MLYVTLFLRAFAIVCVTAANVVFISGRQWGAMFVSGSLLSAIWWTNVGAAADVRHRGAQAAYALGAGAGTLAGAWLGSSVARLL